MAEQMNGSKAFALWFVLVEGMLPLLGIRLINSDSPSKVLESKLDEASHLHLCVPDEVVELRTEHTDRRENLDVCGSYSLVYGIPRSVQIGSCNSGRVFGEF